MLSVGSHKSSLSELQAGGPVTHGVAPAAASCKKCPTPIRAETVSRHNEVKTPGKTNMPSTGHIRN